MRKLRNILALFFLVGLTAPAFAQQLPEAATNNTQENQRASAPQTGNEARQGTDQSPLVVTVLPPPKDETEIAEERKEREQRVANDRATIRFNRYLVVIGALQLAVFIGQLFVFGYQAWKLRQTVDASSEQSRDMKASVAEAAKSASAISSVAGSMRENVERLKETVGINREIGERQKILGELQLRAYISVVIGGAIYQERNRTLRFEAKPQLINSGQTPAFEVRHVLKAAVLSIPIPDNFEYPLPPSTVGETMVPPHQSRTLSAIVDDYMPDAEVETIKRGDGRALCVWGRVNYVDAFREPRVTEFAQILTWLPNGQVNGYFIPNHNTAS